MGVRRTEARHALRYLRRGQHEQVRRNRRKRTLRRRLQILSLLFAFGIIAGAVYVARDYLITSPRFRLHRVTYGATQHASVAEIDRALARYHGRNLFRLDLARMEREVAACRWVRRAVLKRVLPDRLFCAVQEREPAALALIGGRVWLVDAGGTAIDRYGEETRDFSSPILTGLDERHEERRRSQIARGVALLDEMKAAYPRLLAEISEIGLGTDDRIDLHMNEGGPVVRLHAERFDTNLDRYLTMRDYLRTHFGDGAYVDLRFRDRIAFQPLLRRGE